MNERHFIEAFRPQRLKKELIYPTILADRLPSLGSLLTL